MRTVGLPWMLGMTHPMASSVWRSKFESEAPAAGTVILVKPAVGRRTAGQVALSRLCRDAGSTVSVYGMGYHDVTPARTAYVTVLCHIASARTTASRPSSRQYRVGW